MAIKKSDLYSSLWATCDELRGGMDAGQYKDYVLFLLFIKYISDKYGNSDDYRPAVLIPAGSSFKDMIALKGSADIGDKINTQIIAPLIAANEKLARSDFPDFNDSNKLGEGKDMVEKLSKRIGIFQNPVLDFSKNRAEHDDILGDAYEFLMRHFASESGKSKGQFYTPSEVSRILASVIGISPKNTKAPCILPHGVLFRGNAEAVIREQLVRSGILKGIIGLPANLFYGTGIPACILVLDKENATARAGVFMVDASKAFIKDGNKNRLREQDIHRIVDTFTRQIDTPRYARMVPRSEVADPKNGYNLNLPRYIDSSAPEDLQDIDGHLRGGIPERDLDAFAADWQVFPGVRTALFASAGRPGYTSLKLPIARVKPAILGHAEFTTYNHNVTVLFAKWRKAITPRITGFGQNDHPKELIHTVSEVLLAAFQAVPLLDAYDIYQHLMDYWAATLQDDAYLIAADGWVPGAQPREIVQVKDKNSKLVWPEPHDYLLGKRRFQSDLVPARILARRAGPCLPNPHRPHPRTGRTLRHTAAAAHRRGGNAGRARGGTP